MKLNREQITELFGSVPKDQEGKKLVEIKMLNVEKGDLFLTTNSHYPEWMPARHKSECLFPVAIFEDTHRPDGTPMDIAELPVSATPDCVNVIYSGADGPAYPNSRISHWCHVSKAWLQPYVTGTCRSEHNAIYLPIAQPTTQMDLVGDGCLVPWIHWECSECINDTAKAQSLVTINSNGIVLNNQTVFDLIHNNYRWSHNPETPYADATEFVA
jgi:hypothetical protein